MAVAILVKPALVGGITGTAGDVVRKASDGAAGNLGGTAGHDFFMKITAADYDYYSPLKETTGATDVQPSFGNSFMLYAEVRLRGAMIASQAIGIRHLVTQGTGAGAGKLTQNPLGGEVSGPVLHTFYLGGGGAAASGTAGKERLIFNLFLERIRLAYRYPNHFVGVEMAGKMTHMTALAMADLENETA